MIMDSKSCCYVLLLSQELPKKLKKYVSKIVVCANKMQNAEFIFLPGLFAVWLL
jgi:hypothetical protein